VTSQGMHLMVAVVSVLCVCDLQCSEQIMIVANWEGVGGLTPPPPEIPKALQNCAKLKPIMKTAKNC